MKTYFVMGLKVGAFVLIGVGYAAACYYGGVTLGYKLAKKLFM